ncbi:MAG: hypothetical protein HYY09_01685 [Firmicutes bacterium]|nr:hypothetical protein [Bacillota bacterium]
MVKKESLPNGPAAAALLAAGIGSLALGLITILAEVSEAIKNFLTFYQVVGPLSGKTTLAVVAWIIVWGVLNMFWKNKQVDFGKAFIATLITVGLGLLGTFPPFFTLFASE